VAREAGSTGCNTNAQHAQACGTGRLKLVGHKYKNNNLTMATPTHDFPLAGETATQDTGPDIDGSIAGASGSDASGVSLSREGLIAIIVVVCVVGIFGSESFLLGNSPLLPPCFTALTFVTPL